MVSEKTTRFNHILQLFVQFLIFSPCVPAESEGANERGPDVLNKITVHSETVETAATTSLGRDFRNYPHDNSNIVKC
ncbi:hypothetical protein N431DRAFT_429217 [Stipitochalara longipes BDJ]|nr:hypothetical protein N431DRAFT_429217 [Stipitochalara longipes BDJ]